MAVPIQRWQRLFAQSKIPQTNYATPTAGAANFKQVLAKGDNFVSEQPNLADNREYAKGTRQATESWIVSHDGRVTLDVDICAQEIGRSLLRAFGKVVSTQPDLPNNPAAYQHVFTAMDPTVSAQPPVGSIIEQCGPALDALFPSMATQALSFRGEGPQRLGASESLVGSGKKNSPSGIVIAALGAVHYLYQSQVLLTLDDGSTVMNAATAPQRLNSWEFAVQNTLLEEDGFVPGAAAYQTPGNPDSGEVRSAMLWSDQAYLMRFNLRLLSDSNFLAKLTEQDSIIAVFNIIGGVILGGDGLLNYRLQIKAFKAPYRTVNKTTRNGLVTMDIESNVQFDTTTSKDVEVTLVNNVASYTV